MHVYSTLMAKMFACRHVPKWLGDQIFEFCHPDPLFLYVRPFAERPRVSEYVLAKLSNAVLEMTQPPLSFCPFSLLRRQSLLIVCG